MQPVVPIKTLRFIPNKAMARINDNERNLVSIMALITHSTVFQQGSKKYVGKPPYF